MSGRLMYLRKLIQKVLFHVSIHVLCGGRERKLLVFSGFKLRFYTINDFFC